MDVQEDDYPDDGDEQHREDEDEPPFVVIGGGSDDHAQHEGGDPGGDGIELSLDGAVAEGSEDGGSKVGVAVPWNDESKVHETPEDDFEIFEDTEDIPPSRLNVELGVPNILSELCPDERFIVIGKPLGFFREVGDEEKHDRGAYNGHETL